MSIAEYLTIRLEELGMAADVHLLSKAITALEEGEMVAVSGVAQWGGPEFAAALAEVFPDVPYWSATDLFDGTTSVPARLQAGSLGRCVVFVGGGSRNYEHHQTEIWSLIEGLVQVPLRRPDLVLGVALDKERRATVVSCVKP